MKPPPPRKFLPKTPAYRGLPSGKDENSTALVKTGKSRPLVTTPRNEPRNGLGGLGARKTALIAPDIDRRERSSPSLAGTGYENLGKRYYRPSASFLESARIALDALNKSKLRSFLTLLGIILATATLILVMAFVNGMNLYISEKFSDMGTAGFKVIRIAFIGNWDPKKFLEMDRRNPPIRPEEYEFVRDHAHLLGARGMRCYRTVTIAYNGMPMPQVHLEGITADIPALQNTEVARGRTPTEAEIRRHIPVVFIGQDVNQKLFGNTDAIGKKIMVEGVQYEVIGVAKAKGSVFGQSLDNFVSVSIYSFLKTYGLNRNTHIELFFNASDPNHLQEAQDEVRMLLRSYRHLTPQEDDTFSIFSSETLTNAWQSLTAAIAGMALGVVSVFLVVGGIVIMNIMLAVVTERTREIGIRKSLGARRKDILSQFLVESAVLSMTGGIIGVLIAFVATIVVSNMTPLPMDMPLSSILVGVGLSAAVGLFFGIYPARQAAKLDPIRALQTD